MQLSKEQAEREAIRRWYMLPPFHRQTCEDAESFAVRLDLDPQFQAATNRQRLIAAWLIRELFRAQADTSRAA